jgi:hypothetical protein
LVFPYFRAVFRKINSFRFSITAMQKKLSSSL